MEPFIKKQGLTYKLYANGMTPAKPLGRKKDKTYKKK